MSSYSGFEVGTRVASGDTLGTVTEPDYEPSDEMAELRCVPVLFDKDKAHKALHWILSQNLIRIG